MRRKIIKQGLGGCTVSLPIKWIRENKLSPGDEVEVIQRDQNVLISGKGVAHKKIKELHLKETDYLLRIRSIISSAYKSGYDEIIISAENLPSIRGMDKIINSFIGLEIVSSTKNTLRIKSFLQEDESDVENLIIKMFQTINSMIKNILGDWNKLDLENIQAILELNIRKTRDHYLRVMHLTRYGCERAYDYCVLVTQLEKIAANLTYLAEYVKGKTALKKELIIDFQKDFDKFYHLYLKKDFDKTINLWENHRQKIRKTFEPKALDKLVKKYQGLALHYYAISVQLRSIASRMMALSL